MCKKRNTQFNYILPASQEYNWQSRENVKHSIPQRHKEEQFQRNTDIASNNMLKCFFLLFSYILPEHEKDINTLSAYWDITQNNLHFSYIANYFSEAGSGW